LKKKRLDVYRKELVMADDKEYSVHFDRVVTTSDDAILFEIGDVTCWMPISEIRVYYKPQKFYAPEWLLLKKGLI